MFMIFNGKLFLKWGILFQAPSIFYLIVPVVTVE
jgi:hypothetical protein